MIAAGPHNEFKWNHLKVSGIPDKKKWKKLSKEERTLGKDLSRKLSALRDCVNRDITMKQYF